MSELKTSLSIVSLILTIKNKLLESRRTTNQVPTPEGPSLCSIYIEHTFSSFSFNEDEHSCIEIILTKKSDFMLPIRHLDWCFLETKLDTVKIENQDLSNQPKLLEFETNGLVLETKPHNILERHIEYSGLKGRTLKKALKTLKLRVTYSTGYFENIDVPPSLIEQLIAKYSA